MVNKNKTNWRMTYTDTRFPVEECGAKWTPLYLNNHNLLNYQFKLMNLISIYQKLNVVLLAIIIIFSFKSRSNYDSFFKT